MTKHLLLPDEFLFQGHLFTLSLISTDVTYDLSISKTINFMQLKQTWPKKPVLLLQEISSCPVQETLLNPVELPASFTYLNHIARETLKVRGLRGSVDQDLSRQTCRVLSGCQNIQKPETKRQNSITNLVLVRRFLCRHQLTQSTRLAAFLLRTIWIYKGKNRLSLLISWQKYGREV